MILKHIKSPLSFLLMLIAVGTPASSQEFTFDPPENLAQGKPYKVTDDVSAVVATYEFGNFLYLYKAGQRLWKSPPLQGFCMSPKIVRKDIDGNGTSDFWMSSKQCRSACNEFSIFLSLDITSKNYLIHYKSYGGGSDGRLPVLETNEPLPADIWLQTKSLLAETACDEADVLPLVEDEQYTVMKQGEDAFNELEEIYNHAQKLYKERKLIEKSKDFEPSIVGLDGFFEGHDYRTIDPSNKNPRYTQILNDYGFFLSLAERRRAAVLILAYVIKREPARAVAYLNIADVFFDQKAGGEAREHYRTYHDLMLKADKKNKIPARVFERMK